MDMTTDVNTHME